jgi:hypothetical protein
MKYADAFYRMERARHDLGIDYGDIDGREVGLSRRPKRRVRGNPDPHKRPLAR